MIDIDVNYVVHDAKLQLYFYIASDILKKVEKNAARRLRGLKYLLVNLLVNILEHVENHLLDATIRMHRQIILDGLRGNLSRQLVRETELARGDAAEGDAFKTVFIGTSHDASVA